MAPLSSYNNILIIIKAGGITVGPKAVTNFDKRFGFSKEAEQWSSEREDAMVRAPISVIVYKFW